MDRDLLYYIIGRKLYIQSLICGYRFKGEELHIVMILGWWFFQVYDYQIE